MLTELLAALKQRDSLPLPNELEGQVAELSEVVDVVNDLLGRLKAQLDVRLPEPSVAAEPDPTQWTDEDWLRNGAVMDMYPDLETTGAGDVEVIEGPDGRGIFFRPPEKPVLILQRMKWAIAIRNWTQAGGNNSYVLCNPCDNRSGENPDATQEVAIYIPKLGGRRDPNVVTHDVVGWDYDAMGIPTIMAPDGLDDFIGCCKINTQFKGQGPSGMPAGWKVLPNSAMRFVVGYGYTPFNPMGKIGGNSTVQPTWSEDVNGTPITDEYDGKMKLDSLTVLPPYVVEEYIQRYNNSEDAPEE